MNSGDETNLDEETAPDGRTPGFVYLRGVSVTTGVVKRLYVRPAYRGRGIGRALATKLVETAAERGYETLRLTTSPGMEKAQELYADLGFEETEPFETEVPEEFHDICRFMRRPLDPGE
jgi:ribosomal protein S18 acetylase RimI-like enzyme